MSLSPIPRWLRFCCLASAVVVLVLFAGNSTCANEPLHVEIDRIVAQSVGGIEFESADDAAFLRRVSIDLIGRIPSATEIREFLHESHPHKRDNLIDRLLADPEYARNMMRIFDVWLMQRRTARNVSNDQWREYLQDAFAKNRPWSEMTQELLGSDGDRLDARGPARFYLDRECKTDELVRDISTIFLGRNLHCAQCHDHPLITDYRQTHYFGIAAFLDRSFLFEDKPRSLKIVGEKGEGETAFMSALTQVRGVTGPQVFDGPLIVEPVFAVNEVYAVPPSDGVRPIPRFSRRAGLPGAVISHPAFCRNIVNRFWAHMFGRGIIEPLDQDHSKNPPLHPELMELLARRFADSGYDLRMLLCELARTKLYARAASAAPDYPAEGSLRLAISSVRKLSPEQLAWSWIEATGRRSSEWQACSTELRSTDPKLLTILIRSDAGREAYLHRRLVADADLVIRAFVTSLPGETPQSETTPQQALFLLNGEVLQSWVASRPGNLVDRLQSQPFDREVATELFVNVLSRPPSAEEVQWVEDLLANSGEERALRIADLAEALLTSIEFRFNH